jgi:hypothetical protein
MAQNKVIETNSPLQVAVPSSLAYPVLLSNTPLLLGTVACVGNTNDGDAARPADGRISVDTSGAFNLTVTAATALSPLTGSAINPGDKIYADGGTTDSTTGIKSGFTLDKNSSTGVFFGTAVSVTGQTGPLLTSGSTGVIAVRLN